MFVKNCILLHSKQRSQFSVEIHFVHKQNKSPSAVRVAGGALRRAVRRDDIMRA